MNFETMVLRVRETASIPASEAAVVGEFVMEAVRDFARDAATNPEQVTIPLAAGQRVYTIEEGSRILRILPPLEGEPARMSYRVRGLTRLELDGAPTEPTSMTVWAITRPQDLQPLDNIPFPSLYHRAVRYRALQLVTEWDRQDDAEVGKWEAKYEGEVGKAKRHRMRINGTTGLRPSPAHRLGGTRGPGLVLE